MDRFDLLEEIPHSCGCGCCGFKPHQAPLLPPLIEEVFVCIVLPKVLSLRGQALVFRRVSCLSCDKMYFYLVAERNPCLAFSKRRKKSFKI
jgi:hypothetical protein